MVLKKWYATKDATKNKKQHGIFMRLQKIDF